MKKIAGAILLASVIVAAAAHAAGVPPYKCSSVGSGKTITIDGDLSDWRAGATYISSAIDLGFDYQVVRGGTNWQGPSDNSAKMYLAWTKDYLLIGADVVDDAPAFSADGLPNGDNVSVTIDTSNGADPNSDNSLSIDCTPYPPDDTWDSAVVISTDQPLPDQALVRAKATGLGYVIEVAVPFANIPMLAGALNPLVTKSVPFSVTLVDCDENGGARKGVLQYNRTLENPVSSWYKEADSFSPLVFDGDGAGAVKL